VILKNKFCIALLVLSLTVQIPSAFGTTFTPVVGLGLPGGAQESNDFIPLVRHSLVYGFGGIFGFKMFPKMFANFGMLYMPRGYLQTLLATGEDSQVTFNTVQLPITFHYYLLPVLAVGLGGYYSHALGSAQIQSLSGSGEVSTESYGPGKLSADDYGVVVSLSFNVRMTSFMSFVIDGRYLYGLQNVSNINDFTAFLRDFQVLGGIRIGK
jgi:hypothetical protein